MPAIRLKTNNNNDPLDNQKIINNIRTLTKDLEIIDNEVKNIEDTLKKLFDLFTDFGKEIKIEKDKNSVRNNLIKSKEQLKEINKNIKKLKSEKKKNSYYDIYTIRIKYIEENYRYLNKIYKELFKSTKPKSFLKTENKDNDK
ncbi:MAG: hypothetical protein ACP5UN_03270 [Candidatus Micrarchaeia archaeon]